MQVCVVLSIEFLFIAHCSLSNLTVACMHMLLVVNHNAYPCAVHTLACVHAQLLQALSQPSPYVAGGHGLFSKLLGAYYQWPGDEIGDGLSCYCIVIHVHGLLQPSGEAHYVTSQGNFAMTSLLVLGGVWQQMQDSSSLRFLALAPSKAQHFHQLGAAHSPVSQLLH